MDDTVRTQDEINAEIAKLREMKPSVRHHTAFGDDNWAAIDAQIKVLTEHLDEDAIWDEWPRDESDLSMRDAARDAVAWMTDADNKPPSNDWQSLVRSRVAQATIRTVAMEMATKATKKIKKSRAKSKSSKNAR